jgi:hypothetical protein
VEQVQIRIAAIGPQGMSPLGECIAAVFRASGSDAQRLTILVRDADGLRYRRMLDAPPGHLRASTANLWASYVSDDLYDVLLRLVGVQGELEDMPT